MSIERARKAIRGEKTDRIPLFHMPGHREFLKKLVGRDPSGEVARSASDREKMAIPENIHVRTTMAQSHLLGSEKL